MIEKTKVLAAMLAFDEFTPEQVSRFADVKLNTVHTNLRRFGKLLEEVGTVGTGKRGGQPIRYRLTESGRAEAQKQLEAIYQTLNTAVPGRLTAIGSALPTSVAAFFGIRGTAVPSEPPLGIVNADDTLTRLLPQAATPGERLDLLQIAQRQTRSALHELGETTDPSHIRELVEERLNKINAERARIHKENDAQLVAETVPATKMQGVLRRLRERVHRRQPLKRPVHVQIWSGTEPSDTADLRAKIAQSLEKRSDVFVTELPGAPERPLRIGDAVILLVDSRSPVAQQDFQQAFAACRSFERPLVVFDRDYSPGFRNTVLGSQGTLYWNDAGTLDQDGLVSVLSHFTPLSPLAQPATEPKRAPAPAVLPPAAALQYRPPEV